MRFLTDEPRTKALLEAWSTSRPLLIASCFFWLAGSDLQKSFHGLLRSLLYDLMEQNPSLIPQVSPWRWKACELTDSRTLAEWTIVELQESFKRLVETTAGTHNLAIFVDGLDEFHDHNNLTELLKHVSSYSHTRVCASSRPWPVFQNTFAQGPMVRLEHLTAADRSSGGFLAPVVRSWLLS